MSPAPFTEGVWSIDDLELELRRLPGVRAAGFDDVDDMLMVQLHVADAVERAARNEAGEPPMPVSASRIAARHSDRPVAVEVVRWRSLPDLAPAAVVAPAAAIADPAPAAPAAPAPADGASATDGPLEPDATADAGGPPLPATAAPHRVRLLAVLAFPDTDELEVHLVHEGRRTIGRAPVSSGIEGAVDATIDAVRDLGTGIDASTAWARTLLDEPGREQVVVAVALLDVDARTPVNYGLAGGISLVDAAARATLDAVNRRLSRSH